MPLASIAMYNQFLPAIIAQYKLALIEVDSIREMSGGNRRTAISKLRQQASALEPRRKAKLPTVGSLGAIGVGMRVINRH